MKVTNTHKRKIMKAAWTIIRKEAVCLSIALKRAWAWAKKNILAEKPKHFLVMGDQIKSTDKAYLIEVGDMYKVWIPKSLYVCQYESYHVVPAWFADKNLQHIVGLFGIYTTLNF